MIKKTALICDHGLFQPLAHRLAEDYERVLYFRPWVSSFSSANDFQIGRGYDNVLRVEAYEPYFDDKDVTWVFPDLHFADLQTWLRKQGRAVWGAGHGEELELLRGEVKQLMSEIGLPVKKWTTVDGMEELRDYLKDHENVYVKISKFRGICETFCSPSYDLVKPKLDDIEHDLGGLAEVQEFIVEHPVDDATEVGYDGLSIDGVFPKIALCGVEIKDVCYFGKITPYAVLSEQVREVNKKLSPVMKQYGYRGFFSTEIRVAKDKKPYLIDLTCRHASPAGEALLEIVENMGEVIEGGANGELVELKPRGNFVAQAMLLSDFAIGNWLPISIPENIRQHVHLYHSCRINGMEYVVPTGADMPQIGSVTAYGETPQQAIKLCQQYVKKIEAFGLKDNTDKMADAQKELEKV